MNTWLRLNLIVYSLLFPFLAQSHTITSSSEQKEIYNSNYTIKYSENNYILPKDYTLNRSVFLIKGSFLTIAYKKKESKTFKINILSAGGSSIYLYQPGGEEPIRRVYVGETVEVDFYLNGDNDKTKTIFFIVKGQYAENLRIKVNGTDELSINFIEVTQSNYCRLSVIDARGGISFNDYINTNNATFVYDTDSVKSLSFDSKVTGKDHEGNKFSNLIKNELKNKLEYYYVMNKKISPLGRSSISAHNEDLSSNHRVLVNSSYPINSSGVITMSPFVSLQRNKLKSGKYQIKTTVTCNP